MVGPEGRGKTTLLKELMKQGQIPGPYDLRYAYYDFGANANHNFQVMVTQWSSSLISQNPLVGKIEHDECSKVFDAVNGEHDILQITGATWHDTCLLLLKHAPATLGIHNVSAVGSTEPFFYGLYAVGIIAEKAEIESRGEANPSSLLTGTWATKYLLKACSALSQLHRSRLVLCFDGVHHLTRSPFLNDRGGRFLHQLLSGMQANNLHSVLISDDCVSTMPLVDERLSAKLDDVSMQPNEPPSAEATVDRSSLVWLDVPELEPTVARAALKQGIWNCDRVVKALMKVSGGNMKLLSNLVRSYREMELSLDLPAVHQILAGSVSPVDDEYFPLKGTVEEQARYLQEERCKMFVRNVHNAALATEVGQFENLMNRFLSLPAMEAVRHRLNNNVHFWVTVSETVRYLLSKPMLQLRPGATIDNKVVLSLISTGILHLNVQHRTLEFKDSLTRFLIEAFIDNEYESLSWIEQIEYKANYLLNQRTIYGETDRFLL
ncbi:hypothetical protein, conserved [Babesia bigemina]|uniref:Uncharacterized protein n=1 Tax=Babesia bigemina TaxID=5866 RepID=A0A061D9E6_BABBI|nr:hypothetical protein, conserved [Babesia bigemina]CDR97291.1 hypothetical protein, conserved [Babesia bigemina]|eukprot:XP_012769477.1 hypothetical protein, conserved [Babesia bigemina]